MNIQESFRYCPKCAAPGPKVSEGRYITCDKCGFAYYHNTAAAVAAIVESNGRILLTRRAKQPKAGLLDLPGGFADYGETIEQALERELREEIDIEVSGIRYLTSAPNIYVYKDIPYHVIDLFFTCRLDDASVIKTSNEIAGYEFLRAGEIPFQNIAFESTKAGLSFYIAETARHAERNRKNGSE